MPELSVVVISTDEDQRAMLQVQVDSTVVARLTNAFETYPRNETDPVLRRIADLKPNVILLDLSPGTVTSALHAIEILHAVCVGSTVFAIGNMTQPQLIIDAMRTGAQEFLPRPTSTEHLVDAFNRYIAQQRRAHSSGVHGRVFTVLNAKGGNGATTVAVNAAFGMLTPARSVALLDMAPLGNAALHLKLKPTFTIMDALNNLHRLDATLLDGFMTRHESGLHLLAGHPAVNLAQIAPTDFARLFDVVVSQYHYVIVDLSTRLDAHARALCDLADTVLLVANPDLSSLWSAARSRDFFEGSPAQQKIRLIVNRYRKMDGFSDAAIEEATQTKILWKIPNQYSVIMTGIERGMPVAQQNHSEIARCFVDLGKLLASSTQVKREKHWLFSSQ